MSPTALRLQTSFKYILVAAALPAALLAGTRLTAQTDAPAAGQRSDSAITADINSKLKAADPLRSQNLGVWVHDGTATITGNVPTAEQRSQIDEITKSVAGVQSVDDQVTVGGAAASNSQTGDSTAPYAQQSGNLAPDDNQSPQNEPGGPPAGGGPDEGQRYAGQYQGAPPPPPSDDDQAGDAEQQTGPPYDNQPGNQNNGQPYPGQQPPASQQYSPQNGYPPQNGAVPEPRYGERNRFALGHAPMLTLAPQTPIDVLMLDSVDSRHTLPGTTFHAIVMRDIVLPDGVIAIPRGAHVDGTVIDSRPPGKLKGHPKLALELTAVRLGDVSYPLTTNIWARRGPGKGGQTTSNVVGSAGIGAVAGGIVGGGGTALLGAALGGLGGAGLTALSRGPELFVPAESVLTFRLNAPLAVREPSPEEIRAISANAPAQPYPYGRGAGPYYPPYPGYPPPPPMPGAPPGGYPY